MPEPTPEPPVPDPVPEPVPEPSGPRMGWGARLSLVLCLLIGPAYVAWMAGVEGRRALVVAGLILLVAACAGLAHWLMGLTRR